MKAKKLVLCLLLSVAMVATFIPMISFAEEEATDDQAPVNVMHHNDNLNAAEDTDEQEEPELTAQDLSPITSVDFTLSAPLCGTVVTGNSFYDDPEFGDFRQNPQPVVSIPAGVNYVLDNGEGYSFESYNYGMWYELDVYKPIEGTMKAGETYRANVWFYPKAGSYFADDCVPHVTGGTVYDYYLDGPEYFGVEVIITAEHNWSHVVNPAPGLHKNGTQYDQCLGCGATQNAAVAPGWAKYYVKGLKVKKGKGSLTVKWKKQSKKNLKKFNGYQIRYATKSDMSNAKFKKVGKKAASKKIGKLKKKTTYYVQVRTYTKKGGVTYYSKWSGTKKVRTK